MKKFIFIHKPKTAGSYVLSKIGNPNNYLIFDGWRYNERRPIVEKDWTEEELYKISHFDLEYVKQIVHTHSTHLAYNSFMEFKKNKWFSFMFHREPLDTIASGTVYFFIDKYNYNNPEGSPNGINDLDEKMLIFLNYNAWLLPEYWDKIDWIRTPTEKNFIEFFNILDLPYTTSKKQNASSNLGYKYYLENGYISKKTHEKIVNHPNYILQQKLFDKLISNDQ